MTTLKNPGLQQLRWDDDDDELPAAQTPAGDETMNAEDQSRVYLNMASNKADDGETIPLVISEQQQLIQADSFIPLCSKPVIDASIVQDEYLSPISVRAWNWRK